MDKRRFYFKRFSVAHTRSSMKVGVDGVLVGAWADVSGCRRVLDVGCGCGVIALMCAQRAPEAVVTAIDVDADSVDEAAANFRESPWRDRLFALRCSLDEYLSRLSAGEDDGRRFDLVVSNPPFFNSGVETPDSPRLSARHQAELSPLALVECASRLLAPGGRLALIAPSEQCGEIVAEAGARLLRLRRAEYVRGHAAAPVKRVLLEFTPAAPMTDDPPTSGPTTKDSLTLDLTDDIPVLDLETAPGVPTPDYRALCHDFYLKF